MSKPLMTCPKCDGDGQVPMSDELRMVYDFVRRRRGATAPMVADALDKAGEFHHGAWNNRLELLRQAGFVTRRKAGKTWFYSVAK